MFRTVHYYNCSPELSREGLRWEIFNYNRDCIVFLARPASWHTDLTTVKSTVHLPVMNTTRTYKNCEKNYKANHTVPILAKSNSHI